MTTQYDEDGNLIANRTEADAVADIAIRSTVSSTVYDPEAALLFGTALPSGYSHEITDLEQYAEAPRRSKGRTRLVDAESFARYYKKHSIDGASTMYSDVQNQVIVGVLNDSGGPVSPGWRDHVVTLALTKTPAWLRWIANDGKLLDQTSFAEHIEASTPDIVVPDAATMLEVAQSFHAHTSAAFESQKRLRDGQTQLMYRENVTAQAGEKGELEVPSEIQLSLAPFEVGEFYEVLARIRFRIPGGRLSIGYQLDRPDDILRKAFADVVASVEERVGETVLYGTPPQ